MQHILFTLKGCPFDLLDDELYIREVLVNATQLTESTLLDISSYKFSPCGVTAIALLAESHISIHTWPETGVAKCDIFTCGDKCLPEKAVEYMKEAFKATEVTSQEHERI